MKLINTIFFSAIVTILIGQLMRIKDLPGGTLFFFIGNTIIFLFFLVRTIKELSKKRKEWKIIFLQILLVLMAFTIFSKYLYHGFWDFTGIVIVPIFLGYSIFSLIKIKNSDIKLTVSTILYFILSIPLFGFEFHSSPRRYIPKEWYNRYDVLESQSVSFSHPFQSKNAKQLFLDAFALTRSEQYFEAIKIFQRAQKLEPNNPQLLFELSNSYARVNKLERAIALLDSAIMIDDSVAALYNNRGLLYYKLKENKKAINDYQRAIRLDSTLHIIYSNLALVYYYEKMFDNACQSIEKAETLGLKVDKYIKLKRIKRKYCK